MLVTVYCVRRDLSEVTFSLQVSSDFQLHNFRLLCELESGIPAAETQIFFLERILSDEHSTLGSYGIKEGDVIVLLQKENVGSRRALSLPEIELGGVAEPGTSSARQHHAAQQPRQPSALHSHRLGSGEKTSSFGDMDNPALIRSMLLSSPHDLSLLKERNPVLADALLSGSLEAFSQVLREQQRDRALREQERLRLYSADPFDLDAQARIEEEIRQQNIEENMHMAMEEAPESFGQVAMLYINCKVNGHALKAFVDSGAQMTIMSKACAEHCNVMRLVDSRWAGIAKGVGTQRIIGRVHLAQIQIEGDFLQCSLVILGEQPMDMLLGLDMLRRHQCSIDLKRNVLVIGTTGTETHFLSEATGDSTSLLVMAESRSVARPQPTYVPLTKPGKEINSQRRHCRREHLSHIKLWELKELRFSWKLSYQPDGSDHELTCLRVSTFTKKPCKDLLAVLSDKSQQREKHCKIQSILVDTALLQETIII